MSSKEDKLRIKNDRGKLVWIPTLCFTKKRIPSITRIIVDDEITDPENDIAEVTIEFDNQERRWATFLTCSWLQDKLNNGWDFCVNPNFIFINSLTEESISDTILQLDRQNQLYEASAPYDL